MIKNFLLLAFFLALLICPVASAQSVDALIKKSIEAHGGAQRVKALRSTRITGKIQMQGITAPITIIRKHPNMARVEISLQTGSYIEGYDGQTAWRINSFTGSHEPETISGEDAKDILDAADMESPLVGYRPKGHKVELVGKEKVEGVDTYKLKITLKSGEVKYNYMNTRTYLEVKQITKRLDHGVEIEVEVYYSDFKFVAGMLLAHSFEARVGGQTVQLTTIDKIEINPRIDDDIFKMPIKAEAQGR